MISIIVAISRSPLGTGEKNQFQTMKEGERLACLLGWDPAVQGVHPGESVYIHVLDTLDVIDILWPASNFTVYSVEPELLLASQPPIEIFKDSLHRYVQIEVHVPTFDQLQGCGSYVDNPVMTWLQFKIKDPAGKQSPASLPITVWKPWPVIVAIARSPLWDEQKPGDKQQQINSFKRMNDVERAAYLIQRDPAALGVYPGDWVFIYVLDFNPGTQGREYRVSPVLLNLAEGLKVERQDTILTDPFWTYVQIQVRVPTLDQLERSKNYERNALMMGLQFQIENPAGGTSWNSLPILVWMPWPAVKKWDWGSTTIKVGTPKVVTTDPPGPGGPGTATQTGTEITRFLGLPADGGGDASFGQVRWYPVWHVPELPSAPDFINLAKTFGPGGKLVIVMPPEVQKMLSEIRDKGIYIRPDVWNDSYVQFAPPSDPDLLPGVAILWRDDLPSRPVIDIIELANQLWRAHVDIPMQDVEYPVPLGQVFTLGVDQLVGAANNLLAYFLGEGTLSVSFAYQYRPYDSASNSQFDDLIVVNGPKECIGEKAKELVYSSEFKPGGVGLSDQTLSLRVRPKVSSSTPLPEQCGPFTIQLSARIQGKFFDKDIDLTLNIGLPLIFRPEPLVLPTMAIFFQHPHYQGAPLVMFPKDMFGMPPELNDQHYNDRSKMIDPAHTKNETDDQWDARWIIRWNEIRGQIGAKLGMVQDGLKILRELGIDIPYADAIIDVIGRIKAATKLVFDSTGCIADLGQAVFDFGIWKIIVEYTWDDQSFGRAISSVILVGVPHEWSGITVNCYDDLNSKGNNLQLRLPHHCFVAAVADLRAPLEARFPLFGHQVELPYLPGFTPSDSWNDRIASIEIVVPKPAP